MQIGTWGWCPETEKPVRLRLDEDGSIHVVGYVDELDDIGDVNVPTPTDSYVLYWDATAGKWQARSLDIGARAYSSVDLAIPNNAWTVLALNSEVYDTDTMHDLVTNNSRITCKTAGKYAMTAHGSFEANVDGVRGLQILLNGTTILAYTYVQPAVDGFAMLPVATIYSLVVDDYVEFRIYQNSGVALDMRYVAFHSPMFSVQRVG